MSKCIALIHNSQVIIEQVQDAFKRIYPEAQIINIMDESLLRDIKTKDGIDYLGFRRICRYALCAEDFGADAVLMTCSSLCEAVYAAKPMIKIPAFAINEPMSREAVSLGTNIGVLGTLKSVLEPTARLILKKSIESNKTVNLKKALCGAAFEALLSGDTEKHDKMLLTEIESISKSVDVIVFAQGSMSRLLLEAQNRVSTPILECIDSGVKQVKIHFDSQG
jgi:Asp/Glu/hydantoin racemase